MEALYAIASAILAASNNQSCKLDWTKLNLNNESG
jgi:hypothetical protein